MAVAPTWAAGAPAAPQCSADGARALYGRLRRFAADAPGRGHARRAARDQVQTTDPTAEAGPWRIDTLLIDRTETAVIGLPNVFVRDAVAAHAAALAAGLAQVVGHRVDVTAVVDGCR